LGVDVVPKLIDYYSLRATKASLFCKIQATETRNLMAISRLITKGFTRSYDESVGAEDGSFPVYPFLRDAAV